MCVRIGRRIVSISHQIHNSYDCHSIGWHMKIHNKITMISCLLANLHTHTMYRLHKRPNYLNKALCVWLWLLVKEMSGKESQPLTKENLIELENLPMKHVSRKSYGCQVRDSDRIPIEVVLSLTVVLVIFSFWWLWSEESAYTRCVFVHTALSDV